MYIGRHGGYGPIKKNSWLNLSCIRHRVRPFARARANLQICLIGKYFVYSIPWPVWSKSGRRKNHISVRNTALEGAFMPTRS